MSTYTFNRASARVAKARLAKRLGRWGVPTLVVAASVATLWAVVLMIIHYKLGFSLAGLALGLWSLIIWLARDVRRLKSTPFGSSTSLEQTLPATMLAGFRENMSLKELWPVLLTDWRARFILLRYGISEDAAVASLPDEQVGDRLWQSSLALLARTQQTELNGAVVVMALFESVPALQLLLTPLKVTMDEFANGISWIARVEAYQNASRPAYGGLARDWAAGFTPLLKQFGQNLSQQVESAGPSFGMQERTSQLDGLIKGLDSGTGSVILVGEPGIGKSALLLGLADRVLRGEESGSLAHCQIIALNASVLLATAERGGDLERIVLQLFSEAAHAGNIILALDEAQLFFGQGSGAVNLSQILLPILQARSVRLVLAVSPGDWQKLRATNTSMASLLTPLTLAEPKQAEVISILADRALILEGGKVVTLYQALTEAYRLSGRYFPDEAYPGRALRLLEAAMNNADGPFITAASVARAVESQLGVKIETATHEEASVLLNLEDKIHERMINQSRAVSVVASALRRARAGVASPKRPSGSFLFLGPTGVGKTELAKSLAALYFGSEAQLVRLDMSEYQQPADVSRILASASESPTGLLSQISQQPFSVVLLDEIEKANPNILNLLLQLLDEGNLTDTSGKAVSFKDAIIIATSNAGADEIRKHIEAGEELESFEAGFTDQIISSGAFKPELLNRFDEIVLFRPLDEAELAQVVGLLISEINHTLEPQKVSVTLTPAATASLVHEGYDPRLGARPMRRMVQRRVEDAVAGKILRGEAAAGAVIALDVADVTAAKAAPEKPAQV